MFSQTVEYALRAMVCLAGERDNPFTSDEISQRTRLPNGYLSKVMRDLVIAGLVRSQRGPNGGFTLSRDPADINVLDIVSAVDPIKRITSCPMGNPQHIRLCALHERLDAAIAEIERALKVTTLAEVLVDNQGGDRCRTLGSPAISPVTLGTPRGAIKSGGT